MSHAITAAVIFILCAIVSCTGSHDSGVDRIVAERDSMRAAAEQTQAKLDEINSAMEVLVTSLDSISTQEGLLLVNRDPEGRTYSRRQMRQRVSAYAELLKRQRERISELARRLNDRQAAGADYTRLTALIENLNSQIDKKDVQIKQLRAELADKNVNITRLNTKVAELTDSVMALELTNAELDQALTYQDVVINEGYFIAGNSKFLEQKGILSSGFLRKKKLRYEAFAPGNFLSVDIRNTTEFTHKAKKAKLLTPAPVGSYQIVRHGEEVTLRIIDANAFWSLSNYQVLKLD